MSELLDQIAGWCEEANLPVDWSDGAIIVTAGDSAIRMTMSVDKLWLQQRIDVPSATPDRAAIAACRLANLTRRGILNARWRVGFVEITGSLRRDNCSRESVMWLFDEAAALANLICRQLNPT